MTTMSHVLLMLVHMLNNFMVFVMPSGMFTIVVVMMDMSTSLMFFHVMNVMLVIMGMLVSMGMSRYFVM
jgi:hypothetical protein